MFLQRSQYGQFLQELDLENMVRADDTVTVPVPLPVEPSVSFLLIYSFV
jgi:hypothetical protein